MQNHAVVANEVDVVLSDVASSSVVSIVVDTLPSKKQHQLQIAVSALVPRKRTHATDPIHSTLTYYLFWDDQRFFRELDSLLTRLAPLSVVHLASTERARIPSSSKNNPSNAAIQRAQHVQQLLDKLSEVVTSRTDLSSSTTNDDESNNNNDNDNDDNLVHLHPILPKHHDLQDILQHILDEPSFLAFKATTLTSVVTASLHLLLNARGIHLTGGTPQCTSLQAGVMNSHLVLDRTASDTIHLLPPPSNTVGMAPTNPNSSLFGILNRCRTAMGVRELRTWLRQPLVDLSAITVRQDAIAYLLDHACLDRLFDEGISAGWPDVDALGTKLATHADGNVIGSSGGGGTTPICRALQCLHRLYLLAVQQVPVLRDALDDTVGRTCTATATTQEDDQQNATQQETTTSVLLQELYDGMKQVETELSLSKALVETVLDLDEAPRNYIVKSTFSEEMQDVKQELDGLDDELDQCLDDMNNEWKLVSGKDQQVRLESLDSGEWQFRLPNTNDAKLLQARFDGATVHRILKNGVYFSTKELRQLATKKQDLMAEYDKHQRSIVVDAMKVASSYVPVLERCSAMVSRLDVLCSLAHVAAYSPTQYCRPTMTDGEEDGLGIELKGARHPCVELQDSIEYIPNDVSLIFGRSSFLMVTGPNMGGKSTYIRALGAIVTLAQIGAYVPCTSAKINIVHHILARVGAGDVQNSGISTFMAEMLEASSILRTATKRSLIIIDELGRGTSTSDGLSLAKSISEYIIGHMGCMTVFATHFHELTTLEEKYAVAKNCHVTAKTDGKNGLTFLYDVRPRPCLESFGIQVAEMANMPAVTIADAKRNAQRWEKFRSRKKRKLNRANDDVENTFCAIPLDSMNAEEKKQAMLQLLKA